MIRERESLHGVGSWQDAQSPLPGYEHIVAMHGRGGLPFVSTPGPLPTRDPVRDRMILRALQLNGVPIGKGAVLNYAQSEALYRTVRDYFDQVEPLMSTERWMADFVEKRGMVYTDHDGRLYDMKGGVRHPAPPSSSVKGFRVNRRRHYEIESDADSITTGNDEDVRLL